MLQFNNLEQHAQKVWITPQINEKKTVLIEMVNAMKFKAKANAFIQTIQQTNSTKRLDEIAANIMLFDGDKVIK